VTPKEDYIADEEFCVLRKEETASNALSIKNPEQKI